MNKVCFVTGGGSHNGRTMAVRMAEHGYDICIHHSGRDPEGAEKTRKQVEAFGRRCVVLSEDLSQPGAAHRLFEKFRAEFDRLDVFINNAGITKFQAIDVLEEEIFDRVCAIDFKGCVFCVKEACNFMKEKGIAGTVCIIASNHHSRMWWHASTYGSCKEAISRFTNYAAIEYIPNGIHVNCLAPGYIDWCMPEEMREGYEERKHAVEIHEIPAHRWVKSTELADWVEFMTTPAALSLVGQTIDLDGGVSIINDSLDRYGLIPEEEK